MTDRNLIEKIRAFFMERPAGMDVKADAVAEHLGWPYDPPFMDMLDDLYHEGFLIRRESVIGRGVMYSRVAPQAPLALGAMVRDLFREHKRQGGHGMCTQYIRERLGITEDALQPVLRRLVDDKDVHTELTPVGGMFSWAHEVSPPKPVPEPEPEPVEPPPEALLDLIRDFMQWHKGEEHGADTLQQVACCSEEAAEDACQYLVKLGELTASKGNPDYPGPTWYRWTGKPRKPTGEPKLSTRVRTVIRALQEETSVEGLSMCIDLLRDELAIRRTGARS